MNKTSHFIPILALSLILLQTTDSYCRIKYSVNFRPPVVTDLFEVYILSF